MADIGRRLLADCCQRGAFAAAQATSENDTQTHSTAKARIKSREQAKDKIPGGTRRNDLIWLQSNQADGYCPRLPALVTINEQRGSVFSEHQQSRRKVRRGAEYGAKIIIFTI